MDEEPFDSDSDINFEEEEELEDEKLENASDEEMPVLAPPPSPGEEVEAPVSSIGKIPMVVSVEVGKLKLPAEKLLNLQPGNLLSLHLPKSPKVSLVVNGQTIGRGELIEIGDMIGVRILELP